MQFRVNRPACDKRVIRGYRVRDGLLKGEKAVLLLISFHTRCATGCVTLHAMLHAKMQATGLAKGAGGG
jgi:hypothetical protein